MAKLSSKTYSCDKCGHLSQQTTNHYGKTWSSGRFNTCSNCPPYAKYPEFSGHTVWTCVDINPENVHMGQFVVIEFFKGSRLLTTKAIIATNEAYGWSRYLVNLDSQIAVDAYNKQHGTTK